MSLSHTDGTPVPVPTYLISCQLTLPTKPPNPIQCTVNETLTIGTYSITFIPTTRGSHQLQVKVGDTEIISSNSFSVIPVSIPAKMRGEVVKTIDGLNVVTAVAVTDDGSVIVSEEGGDTITILDNEGVRLKSFKSNAKNQNSIQFSICSLAVSSRGTILFASINDNSLMEFSMTGQCISRVGSLANNCFLQFFGPSDITINKTTGQVYVADCINNRVQVLNADLTFSHMFGSCGSGQGHFNYPHGVAIDSQGLVYVADSGNHRIQQFTPEGKHLSSFGTKGSAPGQLTHPRDITLDDNDLLYVCEGDRVSVFTTSGKFLHCFDAAVEYQRCAFDNMGNFYVCNSKKELSMF